ncbi:Metallo-dependent phosphatase-like protein [Achaetomium macrosporum]|uniref:Endopolyphosphatase n=1 Tax=Achaetomium macrosporum TaxID=79813 RepID=A0AAN7CF96_9PEZI|nr:Metallo-dependent phosphatase-like protein [Achaetomium macrosporum]
MKALGRVLALALLCHGVIAGPSGLPAEQTRAVRSAPRKLHGRFLHITDIHPDEFYKVHSSTDEDGACHRGKGPAGPYGAETSDCDSPFSLVNATFDWIAANLKDTIDFVVWTGDSARHDRDEELPRSADQVLGTNTWIADKFAHLFADEDGTGMTIPVVPNFGNNDILPHNILLPGPNKWFQTYLHIWRHFIPEEQRHSFEFGGWFHVEVIPNKLAVFSLNTLYFFDRNAGVDGCANPGEPGYKQMEWLRVQLQFLRERGMKAILIGHVPPARTESKKLWDETCWQKYTLWMHQFRDVVVVGLYGHMNIDHFLIHDSEEIDIAALSGSSEWGIREAMEDDLSVQGASDYLMELRQHWAKLPPPATFKGEADGVNEDGKRRKGKKRKDPWGERYHLTLVGPSIVPTYFPTLRVFEYNITGLEHVSIWKDIQQGGLQNTTESGLSQKHLELRQFSTEAESQVDLDDITSAKKKKKPKKKPKTPVHDPNLNVPSPPAKGSPPGPAYSPQPLTLLGYTQYFANLTHINNLTLTDATIQEDGEEEGWWDWLLRWRKGKHGGKKPASPYPPRPREFAFEVEYSTFEDRIYQLGDLTVNSLVRLAVRIGERVDNAKNERKGEEEEEVEDEDSDGEIEAGKKKKKRKKGRKGRKGKKRRKRNETWLHFLKHAFVGTLEEEELKKFD